MRYPQYKYKNDDKALRFQFYSEGPRGRILKVVEFSKTTTENVYSLGFGDLDIPTGAINDKAVSNNGDSLKVLATVASIVYAFTTRYPEHWVFATGSNSTRTRLYRMGLTNNLVEISVDFMVYGLKNKTWEEFLPGEDYEAFLVRRK